MRYLTLFFVWQCAEATASAWVCDWSCGSGLWLGPDLQGTFEHQSGPKCLDMQILASHTYPERCARPCHSGVAGEGLSAELRTAVDAEALANDG